MHTGIHNEVEVLAAGQLAGSMPISIIPHSAASAQETQQQPSPAGMSTTEVTQLPQMQNSNAAGIAVVRCPAVERLTDMKFRRACLALELLQKSLRPCGSCKY